MKNKVYCIILICKAILYPETHSMLNIHDFKEAIELRDYVANMVAKHYKGCFGVSGMTLTLDNNSTISFNPLVRPVTRGLRAKMNILDD